MRQGESFYKDGTASCGPTLAGSDEEVRLSHNAKRGRSRSCASWLSCPGRRTALWVPLCGFIALPLANEPIQITKDLSLLRHQEGQASKTGQSGEGVGDKAVRL